VKTFLTSGDWGHSTYKAYLDIGSNFESLREKATGVATVCFTSRSTIVLTQHKNGAFDLLGGKIESSETVEDALRREAMEEAGVKLLKWKYFGYYDIKQSDNAPEEYKERYPKEACILFFISEGKKTGEPSGEEVSGSREFEVEELRTGKVLDHVMLGEAIKIWKASKGK
jgi:8-oxo-dGTP pyrophosphatase MutT (NUDIX family)